MNNNRSAGYDTITTELIKYDPEILQSIIKTTLNNCFEQHKQIDIGKGILIALQKPGKPKGPVKNLRQVILLPIIHNILSNNVLQCIKPKVEKYLSQPQSVSTVPQHLDGLRHVCTNSERNSIHHRDKHEQCFKG